MRCSRIETLSVFAVEPVGGLSRSQADAARWSFLVAITLGMLTFDISTCAAQVSVWNQPAFGTFSFSSSWTGGVPSSTQGAVFGGTTGTTLPDETVLFVQSGDSRGAWVASGDYTFAFGNPNLSYSMGDLAVGGTTYGYLTTGGRYNTGNYSLFLTPNTLPISSRLTVGITPYGYSGELRSTQVTVGGTIFEGETARSGTLTVTGAGTHWVNTNPDPEDPFFDDAQLYIGGGGNHGTLRVEQGAMFENGHATYVGGGTWTSSTEPRLARAVLFVDGEGTHFLAGSYLGVGNTDLATQTGSVGSVEVTGGARLDVLDSYGITYIGFVGRDSIPLSMPADRIYVGNESRAHLGSTLSLSDSQAELEISPSTISSDGGRVTIGNVAESETVPGAIVIGAGGALKGIGTILGDVFNAGGSVLPGLSPGALHIQGNYLQSSNGRITLEIGGAVPGSFDQLFVAGDLDLAGLVSLSFVNGFLPTAGDTFDLFHVSGDLDASDAAFNWLNMPPDLKFIPSIDNGVFVAKIAAVPEPSTAVLAASGALLAIGAQLRSRRRRVAARSTPKIPHALRFVSALVVAAMSLQMNRSLAAPLPLVNAGFESPVLDAGGEQPLPSFGFYTDVVSGWFCLQDFGSPTINHVIAPTFPDGALEGANALRMRHVSGSTFQNIGRATPGAHYVLQVDVGDSLTESFIGVGGNPYFYNVNLVLLHIGDDWRDARVLGSLHDPVMPDNGQWLTATLDFQMPDAASLSQIDPLWQDASLLVELRTLASPFTASSAVYFDNVRLDVTPVPEPSTLALTTLGAIGILVVRRRKTPIGPRHVVRGSFRVLLLLLLALSSVKSSQADDVRWFGNQGGQVAVGGVGSFHDGINWDGFAPPGSDDLALLGTGSAPVLPGTPPRYIYFGDATLNYPLAGGEHFVAGGTAEVGGVDVQSGDWTFNFNSWNTLNGDTGSLGVINHAFVGTPMTDFGMAPGTADLVVRGDGVFTIGGSLGVGQGGNGAFTVTDSAEVIPGWVEVGYDQNSTGALTVTGSGALLHANLYLRIGDQGNGQLTVSNGGVVRVNDRLRVASGGVSNVGHGDVVVENNATLLVGGPLTIGDVSSASLIARSGSTIQAGWTDIASTEASGVAEVLIDGLGTRMQSSFIAVGHAGEGVLTVANNAVIELSENLRAAAGGTSGLGHGQIVVRDGGEISAGQSFSIGRTSRGEMSVLSGGNAIADTIEIGYENAGKGEVIVRGSGSRLAANTRLDVGHAGEGLLEVTNNGSALVGNQLSIGALGRVELATGGKINVGAGTLADVPLDTLRVGPGGTLGGTGTILGDVLVDGGSVAPGFSPGTLHIDGNFQQGSLGSLFMEIGGALPGEYDQLDVSGDLFLAGTVSLTFIDGFVPRFGDQFELFRVGGDFDDSGASFVSESLSYDAAFMDGVYTITVVPEPGTFLMAAIGALALAAVVWRRSPRQNRAHLGASE